MTLFSEVTTGQMQAARILTGATMAAFIAAPLFGRHAGKVRIGIAALYLLGIVAFIVDALV